MRLLSLLLWSAVAGLLVGSVRTALTEGADAAAGMAVAGLVLGVAGLVVDGVRKLVSR